MKRLSPLRASRSVTIKSKGHYIIVNTDTTTTFGIWKTLIVFHFDKKQRRFLKNESISREPLSSWLKMIFLIIQKTVFCLNTHWDWMFVLFETLNQSQINSPVQLKCWCLATQTELAMAIRPKKKSYQSYSMHWNQQLFLFTSIKVRLDLIR